MYPTAHDSSIQDCHYVQLLMDETSGRLVIPAISKTCRHIFWDFSPLYRDNT